MAIIMVFVVAYFFGFAAIITKYASVANLSFFDGETNYKRTADPNTMENYLNEGVLGLDKSSRHAGRIWSDKTVFATGYNNYSGGAFDGNTLQLDNSKDGTNSKIKSNTDFLHVFSTIGSSQVVDQYTTQPLDVVLLLDISTSMTESTIPNPNDPLHKVIDEANTLISQLMGEDSNYKVNDDNRVGVVVYGGGAQQLLPLRHYESSTGNKKYMQVETSGITGPSRYFPLISTSVNGYSKTSKVMRADSTYLQGALYEGMEMLANEDRTTYLNKVTDQREPRTPVLIVLTDGATNIVSATETSHAESGSTTYNWWNPYHANDGIIKDAGGVNYTNGGWNPFYTDCSNNTGHGTGQTGRNGIPNKNIEIQAISSRSVSNLLLAGYYQKKIESNYKTDMKGYSIGFNINGLGDYANEQLLATLDPKTYFDEDGVDRKAILDEFEDGGTKAKAEIEAARNAITSYVGGGNPKLRFPRNDNEYYIYTPTNRQLYSSFTWNHPNGGEDVNDLDNFDDIYYVDKYYTAETANIGDIFADIFQQISGSKFNPIDGENDAGVNDSLVYMDPIGEYMEVKDKGVDLDGNTNDLEMTLFEKNYGLVKTAVYDYNFNVAHRNKYDGIADDDLYSNGFLEGWYDEDGELVGYYDKDDAGNNKTYHAVKTIDGDPSFNSGYTYYANVATARQYISTLSGVGTDDINTKEKNTVYTMYRIDDRNRNNIVLNPCYEKSSNISYKLSDIRVWLEETGDFEDDDSGSVIDNGYDDALYINIPKNALPILTANISIDTNDAVDYQMDVEFKNNMDDEKSEHPTPFRLFYGVGVSDDIKSADGLDIDMSKLSNEYISTHTVNDDDESGIYFLSNYYSDTEYNDSVEVTQDTASLNRGDPNTTFSPAGDNRYYAFQKPLVIYKPLADGDSITKDTEVDLTDSGAYQSFLESHKGSMITDPSELEPDDWYVIIIDYYVRDDETGKGRIAHRAVTRKGSEFGVVKDGEGNVLNPGEYLAWYNTDDNGKVSSENIKPFDNEHLEQPKDGTWVLATKIGGLRTGNLAKMNVAKDHNVTKSASTVYVPTISNNTDSNNTIVNNYLGNNGRIVIPNKLLQVTKEVKSEGGEVDPNKEFKFEVTINNYVGDHEAIVLVKNPFSNEWQLRLNSIDIVTDNKGLLQTEAYTDGSVEHPRTVTTIRRNGADYYIYIGGSASVDETGNSFPLFRADSNTGDVENLDGVGRNIYVNPSELSNYESASTYNTRYLAATRQHPAGSIEYWVDKAYLVPKATADGEGWTFDEGDGYETLNRFVISTLDSNKTGAEELSSSYVTKSSYLTKTLHFGYDSSTLPEEKPDGVSDEDWNWMKDTENNKYKAQFTLKDGEGLEFTGIGEDEEYTITEILSDDEKDDGYYFDSVIDETNAVKTSETVNGVVDSRQEEHYYNKYRANYDLKLSKEIMGSLAEEDQDEKTWHFHIKLTPEELEGFKTKYTYQKCSDIDDDNTCVNEEAPLEFKAMPDDENVEYYEAIIPLKAGDVYKIKNIDYKTHYEVVESEANTDEYDTSIKTEEGYDSASGEMDKDKNVGIINAKFAPGDLTIRKTVKGSLGDVTKDFTFKITLTKEDGYVIKDFYNYTGSMEGNITFTDNEDGTYSGYITLKHGQYVTIKDLPEGIHYKVEEVEANEDGYITTVIENNAEGEIEGSQDIQVSFVNAKYDSRRLSVGKRVEGSKGDKDKDWTFDIFLIPEDGVWTEDSYTFDYIGSNITDDADAAIDGEVTFTRQRDGSYKGEVTLKHGQLITIEGLPEGTQYLINEQEANEDGYKTDIPGNNSGMLTDEGEEVIFVNTLNGTVDLEIEKQVTGESPDTDKDWHFDVYLTPPVGVSLKDEYDCEGDFEGPLTLTDNKDGSYKGEVTLKHNQKVTIKDLPEGTRYKVEEREANKDGYITQRTDNTTGDLVFGDTPHVKFTNINLPLQSLTITKEVLGEAGDKDKDWTFTIVLTDTKEVEQTITYSYDGGSTIEGVDAPDNGEITFERQTDESYKGSITLRHGQYVTIENLPDDCKYKVEENEAGEDNYITYSTDEEGNVTSTKASLVVYNNNLPGLKDLTLSKLVHGVLGIQDGKEFNFNIKLTPSNENIKLGSYNYDGTKEGTLEFKDDDNDGVYEASVKLSHEDTITIHGIPEDTKYEIEEDDDDYEHSIDGRVPGRLIDDNTNVVFHNTKLSNFDLSIKKNVKGNRGDHNKFWTFEVILTFPSTFNPDDDLEDIDKYFVGDEEHQLYLSKNAVGNYVGEVRIKDGQTGVIKGLPEGTKYVVEEKEADQDGYITKATDNTDGTMISDENVIFNNWKFSTHRLVIEKRLRGNDVENNREWTFEVTLTPDGDTPFEFDYPYVKNNGEEGVLHLTENEDGTYSGVVKLKGGEYISIEDIPYNTKYDVKEVEANKDNYKTTDENSTGILTKREHKAIFINERNKDKPELIEKIVNNPFTADGIVKYFLLLFGSILGGFAILIREFCFKK